LVTLYLDVYTNSHHDNHNNEDAKANENANANANANAFLQLQNSSFLLHRCSFGTAIAIII
jgi:hypothetical protein